MQKDISKQTSQRLQSMIRHFQNFREMNSSPLTQHSTFGKSFNKETSTPKIFNSMAIKQVCVLATQNQLNMKQLSYFRMTQNSTSDMLCFSSTSSTTIQRVQNCSKKSRTYSRQKLRKETISSLTQILSACSRITLGQAL
ncbi:hypothetical protein FGO68_gene3490 [Halteria grandinella]|uniref:Uncharacterized protein n=1 Tax=Halteria grandinella TaxID=5974 RepID=A0A8J8P5U0_HALGN|nr:hypothetical protein FGO68_gene3490 [Halteria grandinella]